MLLRHDADAFSCVYRHIAAIASTHTTSQRSADFLRHFTPAFTCLRFD